ncbi:MAG: DNA polymerase III subunit alpha [Planctomycetes bacterium]|nr:DNA polymerase III subunit alpha [Planctomycetota bacterium]
MSNAADFVHLHVHSHYSLLDGANRIDDLVASATKDGHTALALTDHGNLFGAIEHYSKCKKAGVRPIIGCESYIARKSRMQKTDRDQNPYDHLTLLCANREGYQNLIKLSSIGFLEGFHMRPRIDKEALAGRAKGLIALSGCLSGHISRQILQNDEAGAMRCAGEMQDLFGKGNFYLELMRNGMEIQAKVTEAVVRISKLTGIPLVATNDIHYVRHEDCRTQDVLLCINTKAKVRDEKRWRMDTDTLFFRTKEEMADVFHDIPESLRNTVSVAEMCNLELELGKYRLPKFSTGTEETPEQLFDRLCAAGLAERYPESKYSQEVRAQARARLAAEMNVIRSMGFVAYFLIVWDLIRYARETGISVGPGRGSAAGSIVAYALRITDIDPLFYDLLFERFLNPERISMPDIDIDFCMENRGRMIEYARKKYGDDCVSQIVTFNSMKAKAALRDVGRVLEVPLPDVDRIARKVPDGPNVNLEKCIKDDAELGAFEADSRYSDLFKIARRVEGLNRNAGVHAAGVVIADVPLDTVVPLYKVDDVVVTQYDMDSLEKTGLLKMDFLGLRTLTILEKTRDLIRRRTGETPDLEQLIFDDPKTFDLLTIGNTQGVFQLESDGMRRLLAKIRPNRFEDIIAVLALYRPGPLGMGMHEIYADRKNGLAPVEYPVPQTEPILKETYGVIVYQEQVMRIANVLAGFSLAQADTLRKAMGKKDNALMAKFEATFVGGCAKNGVAKDKAQQLWQLICKFAEYGFNKSHSAAYAVLTYRTAWLKANYPVEFLAANMTCEINDTDTLKQFVDDTRRLGIRVLGPDINKSERDFAVETLATGAENGRSHLAIRYGLSALKGMGHKAADAIVDARRKHGAIRNIVQLLERVDAGTVSKGAVEALVGGGAMDSLGVDRGRVFIQIESAIAEATKAQADRRAGQRNLFAMFGDASGDSTSEVAGGGAAAASSTPAPAGPSLWSSAERLSRERASLGFYLTGHPMERIEGLLTSIGILPTTEIASRTGDATLGVAGIVTELKVSLVKTGQSAGQKMARFRLEDLHGAVSVIVFPRTYAECGALLTSEGTVVIVRGRLDTRNEDPSLVAEKLESAENALAHFDGAIVVRLHCTEVRDRLKQLLQLFRERPGKTHLFVDVEEESGAITRIRAGDEYRTAPSDMLSAAVSEKLAPGRLRLIRL